MNSVTAIELYYHDGNVNAIKVGQEFGGEPVLEINAPGGSPFPFVAVFTATKRYTFRGVPFLTVEERAK